MAVEQPLGLALEIIRQRNFVKAWQDHKRPRSDDEEAPPPNEWVERIQAIFDEPALADVRQIFGG